MKALKLAPVVLEVVGGLSLAAYMALTFSPLLGAALVASTVALVTFGRFEE